AEQITGDIQGEEIFSCIVLQSARRDFNAEGKSRSKDFCTFHHRRRRNDPPLGIAENLESCLVRLCFLEAVGEEGANPEFALDFLAKHCQWVVVTLGPNGCIAKHGKE
ncbi:hypothetical protein LOK49_LG04G01257, partial [Camellia lanceoleosa]